MPRQSANEFGTVEVVNMVQRRRWPLAEKLRIVEESLLPGMSVSFVARKHGVAPHPDGQAPSDYPRNRDGGILGYLDAFFNTQLKEMGVKL